MSKKISVITPLMIAASAGNINEIKALLKSGSDINQVVSKKSEDEYSSLSEGTKGRNILRPPLWNDIGKTMQSTTALACAIENDQHNIVKLLLQNGANPQTLIYINGVKITHILYAAKLGKKDILALLIPKKIKLKELTDILNSVHDEKTFEYLLRKYNKMNVVGWLNKRIVSIENVRMTKLFMKYGADSNAVDSHSGNNVLMQMMTYDNNELAQKYAELLIKKINVNHQNRTGRTALFYAVSKSLPIVEMLMKAGANVNISDNHGRTPLIEAANYHDNNKIIQALIRKGAKVNATDSKGRNALYYASKLADNKAVIELLKRYSK